MGTVKDIDGNTYNTKIIGSQEWMIENLRVTKYSKGPLIVGTAETGLLNSASNAYPHIVGSINKNPKNDLKLGRAYNLYSILEKYDKIAPTGWRVAKQVDWVVLSNYLNVKVQRKDWYSPTLKDEFAYDRFLSFFGEDAMNDEDNLKGCTWWALGSSGAETFSIYKGLVAINSFHQGWSLFPVKCVKDI